ncbi:hypothetical protein IW140_005200 [Coemansia sp. RSA 1813]|nr:hypothetical protein EV178_002430 [Coemansia sp. RSA 1646]KAJ1768689.1 hypothetical protein LPJ74_004652 [Coemansia sp. RSA 1843]KAJ2093628.1 hypothetical protein IW138_000022 [Coemansia sp. RSA 986]KAJ2214987.1 hypothetical protein EV179_002517 [Coemansia sp. RSA 487]KAJ2565736.1 hypothetical protein IW140_005200 [Coemansia sp. RSA 1813]
MAMLERQNKFFDNLTLTQKEIAQQQTAKQDALLDELISTHKETADKQNALLRGLVDSHNRIPSSIGGNQLQQELHDGVISKYPLDNIFETPIAIAEDNASNCVSVPFGTILVELGENWSQTWNSSSDNRLDDSHINEVVANYLAEEASIDRSSGDDSEKTYQSILNVLVKSVEAHLVSSFKEHLDIKWVDTHSNPMPNGCKPNGALVVSGSGVQPEWAYTVTAFEIKGSKHAVDSKVLRGQLLANLKDMSGNQPRRYSLGLTISKGGEVQVYLWTLTKVFYAPLACLPVANAPEADIRRVIKFLILLYKQLPEENCGFFVLQNHRIFDSFYANEIHGYMQEESTHDLLKTARIRIIDDKAFSGRRRAIVGSHSWLYNVRVSDDNKSQSQECILKLHWYYHNLTEVRVHERALEIGVPRIPQLLGSASVSSPDHGIYSGEFILMDNSGKYLSHFFKGFSPRNAYKVVDMFSGYLHALLVAVTGDSKGYLLHRDISARNLLVKDSKPYVIDWGSGLIAPHARARKVSPSLVVGTAPYMGVRLLAGVGNRSLLGDLESLFLVLSHCLWGKYGNRAGRSEASEFENMWDGSLNPERLLEARSSWLESSKIYREKMEIMQCPEILKSLAIGMFMLLFSDINEPIRIFARRAIDSRLFKFKAGK